MTPLPPGSLGLPVIGETLAFLRAPGAFASSRMERHGRVFKTHLLGSPTVFLVGPEANRWIFAGENRYLVNRWSPGIRRLLGARSVAMLTGDSHRSRRKLLAPHFTLAAARAFVPRVESIARAHLARWAERTSPVVLFDDLRSMVFEMAVSQLVGDAVHVDRARLSRLFEASTAGFFSPIPLAIPGTTFARALAATRELHVMLGELVRARRALPAGDDVLWALLGAKDERGAGLTDEELTHELQLLLFAGHDTTVTSTSHLLWLLAERPEIVLRAREEQRALGLPALGLPALTLESLRAMPYLDAIVREGLRHSPPVPGAFRMTTEDCEFAGYRIPRGWTVALGIAGTHQGSPWTDADRFDPERFLPPRAEQDREALAWIPFGGGPRLCVGQHLAMVEMLTVLAIVLRDYAFTLEPGQDLTVVAIPFPRPKSGVRMRFAPLT